MAALPELLSAGLLAAGAGGTWFAVRRRGPNAGWDSAQERRIRVRGGYEPAEVHVTAGAPVRLVFRREETTPCSERVVFTDLGISAALPAFSDTTVELPASQPGAHPFTCEMEMLHGLLIVDPATGPAKPARQDLPVTA